MKAMKHLYVGEYATHVHVFCGWHQLVHIRHTTTDWKAVTCVHCLGRRDGLGRLALTQAGDSPTTTSKRDTHEP